MVGKADILSSGESIESALDKMECILCGTSAGLAISAYQHKERVIGFMISCFDCKELLDANYQLQLKRVGSKGE